MSATVYCCIHCGEPLMCAMFLNPWLVGYEHRAPRCAAGELWYAENVWKTAGGYSLKPEREVAVAEQRKLARFSPQNVQDAPGSTKSAKIDTGGTNYYDPR